MQRKIKKSGRPLLQTSRLSVHYPRFYLALSKPGSLSFENMEISEILKNKRKKKSQAAVGRTRYIGLNIYTEAIQNCTARAPGATEAARGGRLGRPARVYCFEREEAAAGNRVRARDRGEGGSCRGGPSSPRRSCPGGGGQRALGARGCGRCRAPLNRPRRSLRLPRPPSSPGCWPAGP